jgi:glycosyltransferase involved in cell wall biosynthesis
MYICCLICKKQTVKILILYTEIAGYVLACVREFIALYPDVEVHIVRYPINKEAPFEIATLGGLTEHDRQSFDRASLIKFAEDLHPQIVICSGWVDKDYLATIKRLGPHIQKVMVLDNHWTGSLKQRILRLLSPLFLRPYFNTIWVPGLPQADYAQKLGFKSNQILSGFYCGDVNLFSAYYTQFKLKKETQMPKRFICVARYIEAKNLQLLWDAFIELYDAGKLSDWELYCVGTGEGFSFKQEHKAIVHKGFIQPEYMSQVIGETGVFVLPSKFEPWGVVVHEFAAAGYPMLVSNRVGAATEFVINEKNGYLFNPYSKEDLKEKLMLFASLSNKEFKAMSDISIEFSQKINTTKWAQQLYNLVK